MTRGRHARPSKLNQKVSVAVIAGVAGVGTMFSMVPASFADTLASNNESQNTASKTLTSALKVSGLHNAQTALTSVGADLDSLSLNSTGYQTQSKQQSVAKNLSTLINNLGEVLHATPYASKLSAVQSALEGVQNTLKTPNLVNSDLEGEAKTQGQLQNIVKQLQSIIDDASAQYGTELKNAVNDYNGSNLPATESGVNNAIKAAQSAYNTAQAANNPTLSSANNTFSTNAADALNTAGSTSDSSTILGKAETMAQNAANQLNTINSKISGYSNGTSTTAPTSGSLLTDAQNFDTWAHTWWSSREADNSYWTGYQSLLSDLSNCIDAINNGKLNGSTITGTSSSGAQAILQNLEVVREAVETLQTLTKDSDLASKTTDQAYQLAYQYAFAPAAGQQWGGDIKALTDFINQLTPLYASSTGTAPSPVTGPYSTYEAWPSDNPFGGAGATALWTDLSNIRGLKSGLPEWASDTALKPIMSAWEQGYSNYRYLQAVQPHAQTIESEAQTALEKAQDAASKIAAAKQLADQNTGDSASDAAAAAQAKADIQAALQDVAAANSAGEAIKTAMSSAAAQYASATSSSPTVTVTVNGTTENVPLPKATNEDPIYSSSEMDTINNDFGNYVKQANNMLSGSDSGTGTGGLLGDATAWQKAIVIQGVFNSAQKAYDDIQKVQQDLNNVRSAANPGAAIDSLKQLQSDLTPLINSTHEAIEGMQSGNETIQGLGLQAPYSQSDIDSAKTPLTSSMPLSSSSNADNPIQKAIGNGNSYNFAHPIVAGMDNLQPTIRTLIGKGSEQGLAQKILALPFETVPAASLTPEAAPSEGIQRPSALTTSGKMPSWPSSMPSGGQVSVQSAKPEKSNLASTGSDVAAATIGAAILLAAGVAAELLKKKKAKEGK